jgi:hypothetical protein
MSALQSLLDDEMQQFSWRVYLANACWAVGASRLGKDFMPAYTDTLKHNKPDNRSGEQIVDDLAAKLRRRIRERGETK